MYFKACMTDRLLQAQHAVLTRVLLCAKLKVALKINICKF